VERASIGRGFPITGAVVRAIMELRMEKFCANPARSHAGAIRGAKSWLAPARSKRPKWFPWLLVLSASFFYPLAVAGRPAAIGPEEQLFQQFDVGAHGPPGAWKVSFRVDNDDCVSPSLGCFYFQEQADSSWSLYSAVGMDVSSQHPDNACHLATPAQPGSYRLFALNTTKTCQLRIMFRESP
jgi:hypothetical protein